MLTDFTVEKSTKFVFWAPNVTNQIINLSNEIPGQPFETLDQDNGP